MLSNNSTSPPPLTPPIPPPLTPSIPPPLTPKIGKSRNQPNIINDDEKPCCSKSIRKENSSSPRPHHSHNRHVRFSDEVHNESQAEQIEQKPILPESSHTSPDNSDSDPPSLTEIISVVSTKSNEENEQEFLSADKSFSDSVLTLPNLLDYESDLVECEKNYLSTEKNSYLSDNLSNRRQSARYNESQESFKNEASFSSSPNRISSGHLSSKPPKLNFLHYLSTWNSKDDNGNEHDDDYEEGYSTEHDEEGEYDENNNVILWYIFYKITYYFNCCDI